MTFPQEQHIYTVQNDGTTIDRVVCNLIECLETFYSSTFTGQVYAQGHKGLDHYSQFKDIRTPGYIPCKLYVPLEETAFDLEPFVSDITCSPLFPQLWPATNTREENIKLVRENILANQLIAMRNKAKVYKALYEVLALDDVDSVMSLDVAWCQAHLLDEPYKGRQSDPELIKRYQPIKNFVIRQSGSNDPSLSLTQPDISHGLELHLNISPEPLDAFVHCCPSSLSELAKSHIELTCKLMSKLLIDSTSKSWLKAIRFRNDNRDKFAILEQEDLPKRAMSLYVPGEVRDELIRECEDMLREELGLPKIGDGFIYETLLANTVAKIYPDSIREHSPSWLGKQRLDIYIPSLKIALEYNGEQHYYPIEFFGGKKGFEETKARDIRKRQLCQENHVTVIDWKYTEKITETAVNQRIEDAINKQES